jgi:hypothetical protein
MYSEKYYRILETRRKLPVYQFLGAYKHTSIWLECIQNTMPMAGVDGAGRERGRRAVFNFENSECVCPYLDLFFSVK